MANRARRGDALFVKDGVPVKFCFHRSVTEGRGQITRDVERHGGQIVPREDLANVLLVDEQEDLAFFRRRYYSSTEMYRLSLYIEPRGFVQACLRSGVYQHYGPIKQGMPGRARGGGRQRVPFTEEDRDHLAYYLATRCPTRDGRMGMNAYKDLERLGQTDDPSWAWASRHTLHSWREHYKMRPELMDARIDFYLQRLKGIGHHFGHDPRTHGHRDLRRELREEEEEDEGVEEEQQQRRGRQDRERRSQVRPLIAAQRRPGQAARDYLASHEQDLVAFDEEEGLDGAQEGEEEEIPESQRRHKRHRADLDAQRQRGIRETQAKRARVLDRASGVEAGRGGASPAREEDTDAEDSEEIEGSDLFGDRTYDDDEPGFDFNAQEIGFPKPFSSRASPVPEQDGPPLSTQATLVASPRSGEKEHTAAPTFIPTKGVEVTLRPAPPLSSQRTLVVTQERVTVQRARAHGSSAQLGPSMSSETRTRGGAPAVDVSYRNARARSRSADTRPQPQLEPESQLPPHRKDQGGRGKGKAKEEVSVSIDEDIPVKEEPKEAYTEKDIGPVSVTVRETFEDEMAVEGLLEASVEGEHDKDDGSSDGDEDWDIMSQLSRFQEIEIEGEPSDSDDAETHASLVRDAVRAGSAGGGGALEKSGSKQDQDQSDGDEDSEADDADRIERMANGSLHPATVPSPVRPRVTRSMAATQRQTQQTSPRRTRSGNLARGAPLPTAFPSPGTKAREVVDRFQEEERRMPYAPPPRTRAAMAVKEKGRRT